MTPKERAVTITSARIPLILYFSWSILLSFLGTINMFFVKQRQCARQAVGCQDSKADAFRINTENADAAVMTPAVAA